VIELDCIGDICPMPVIKAKKELESIKEGSLIIMVDNEIAAQNLEKLAKEKACAYEVLKDRDGFYRVSLHKNAGLPQNISIDMSKDKSVVVISSDKMGDGDDKLGQTLIKGFIYALRECDKIPDAIVFYNSGAHIAAKESESVEDLKKLEEKGVLVLTCGACLDFYGYKAPLAGKVTNMYEIVEKFLSADKIIRP